MNTKTNIKKPKKKLALKLPNQGIQKNVQSIAYVYTDTKFGEFAIRTSANAWWMSETKLHILIKAFKTGLNDKEACADAGITLRQMDHFIAVHPSFCEYFQSCKLAPRTIAKFRIYQGLTNKDERVALSTAQWFAEHKMQDEYSKRNEVTGADGSPLGRQMPQEDDLKKVAESVIESCKLLKETNE